MKSEILYNHLKLWKKKKSKAYYKMIEKLFNKILVAVEHEDIM